METIQAVYRRLPGSLLQRSYCESIKTLLVFNPRESIRYSWIIGHSGLGPLSQTKSHIEIATVLRIKPCQIVQRRSIVVIPLKRCLVTLLRLPSVTRLLVQASGQ